MSELRRLLIDRNRLIKSLNFANCLVPTEHELHYLKRVLRLRKGDLLNVIDGCGHLWDASLNQLNQIQLTTSFKNPLKEELRVKTLICLAVVIPKKGFEDILRMSTEMGIDIYQPLISERSVVKGDFVEKFSRWETIIREAVEQSERLWAPELREKVEMKTWLANLPSSSAIAIATTREINPKEVKFWLDGLNDEIEQAWIAIGPEGGWSAIEIKKSIDAGCVGVTFGENILRTSTAAVAASQLLFNWRRINLLLKD